MGSLVKIPKIQLAETLLAISLSALYFSPSLNSLKVVVLALLSTILADAIFLKIRKIPLFVLSAAIVSGLIIGLLYSPLRPWYEVILVAVLAMFSKNFIRMKNRHIFNPAGFGLFFGSLLFRQNISWWAVSFQQIFPLNLKSLILFLILVSPAYVSLFRMRRYKNVFTFLIILTLANFVMKRELTLNSALLDPTTLFFALVMLPEPMTTPVKRLNQILFGGLTALVATFSSSLSFLPDSLIFALLISNLIFFFL